MESKEGEKKDKKEETEQGKQVGGMRKDKLGKEEARHSVYSVLLSGNKSQLLFFHSCMTAGIVKHT